MQLWIADITWLRVCNVIGLSVSKSPQVPFWYFIINSFRPLCREAKVSWPELHVKVEVWGPNSSIPHFHLHLAVNTPLSEDSNRERKRSPASLWRVPSGLPFIPALTWHFLSKDCQHFANYFPVHTLISSTWHHRKVGFAVPILPGSDKKRWESGLPAR